jgi:hypothetical protein
VFVAAPRRREVELRVRHEASVDRLQTGERGECRPPIRDGDGGVEGRPDDRSREPGRVHERRDPHLG